MKLRIIVERICEDNKEYWLREHDNSVCFSEIDYSYGDKDHLAKAATRLAEYVDRHIQRLKELPRMFLTDEDLKDLEKAEVATSAQ